MLIRSWPHVWAFNLHPPPPPLDPSHASPGHVPALTVTLVTHLVSLSSTSEPKGHVLLFRISFKSQSLFRFSNPLLLNQASWGTWLRSPLLPSLCRKIPISGFEMCHFMMMIIMGMWFWTPLVSAGRTLWGIEWQIVQAWLKSVFALLFEFVWLDKNLMSVNMFPLH